MAKLSHENKLSNENESLELGEERVALSKSQSFLCQPIHPLIVFVFVFVFVFGEDMS